MSVPQVPGYLLNSRLGQGAFGSVYQAMWNGDFACALKVLEEGALHREYLAAVLDRLSDLEPHPGLLPLYAFDLEGDVPHLSMALLPDGMVTFDDLAGQLTRDEAWVLLGQLADSLAWLHRHGLVHAGVTGGNVFVVADGHGEPRALLADVGQAWLGDGSMERLHDQAPYVPPERWREPGQVLQDGHAETWDVYAFGVLAWRLLNGRWPRANQLFDRVLSSKGQPLTIDPPAFAEWLAQERPPMWPDQSRDTAGQKAREIVLRCLSLDPAARPDSMVGVAAALREFAQARAAVREEPGTVRGGTRPVAESPMQTPTSTGPSTPVVHEAVDQLEDLLENIPEARPAPPLGPKPAAIPTVEPVGSAPLEKRDCSSVFTSLETGVREATAPVAAPIESIPVRELTEPVAGPAASESARLPSVEKGPGTGGTGRRLAVAASLAVGLGGAIYGFQHREAADQSRHEMAAALQESAQAKAAAAAAAAGKIKALENEQSTREVAAVAAARDEWAGLAAAVLAARPVEPAAVEAWKPAAAPIAERLKSALEAAEQAPSLTGGSMEPRWQLARLYETLGQPDEALPLLEQLARDLEATAATAPLSDAPRGLLTARVSSRRGAILLEARRTLEAAPLLQDASAAYESWLTTHSDRHDIARESAVNSLLEGKALFERQQAEAARSALARIPGLLGKPEDGGFLPEHYFTLTDSLLQQAEMDSGDGKLETAIEQHMQAVRLLVAYDQDHRQSVPCRRRLAEGYFGLGRLLTKNGTPRDASVAFSEAVKLLTELSKEAPGEPAYRLQLALTYNEVAQLIRTARPNPAGAKEALEYQNGSVTILRNLNETNPQDKFFRRHLAAGLVLNGELSELAADPPTGLARITEAQAIVEELLEESSLSGSDRRECLRLSARAWTAMGGMQEAAGRKEDAIASLNQALEAWSGFAGDDPAADKIVASTRERLRKLKPGS